MAMAGFGEVFGDATQHQPSQLCNKDADHRAWVDDGTTGEKKRLVPRENWEINAVGGDLRNARSRAFAEATRFPRLPWTFGGGGPGRRDRFVIFHIRHTAKSFFLLRIRVTVHGARILHLKYEKNLIGREIICFFFCLRAKYLLHFIDSRTKLA